jgi:hypothetical protein
MLQKIQSKKLIDTLKINIHNLALLLVVSLLWAIDHNYLGIIPSLAIVAILLLGTIYSSFVFISRIERTLLLIIYFYLCYVGIGLFEFQYILEGMAPVDARYISYLAWTGLGFEDIKPIPTIREYIIWTSVFGYVANAGLIAIFIRCCTPTWLLLKEGD